MKNSIIDHLFWFVAFPKNILIEMQKRDIARLKREIGKANENLVAFRIREAQYQRQIHFLSKKEKVQGSIMARFVKKDPKLAKVIDKEIGKAAK
jgi:hypothetical protein